MRGLQAGGAERKGRRRKEAFGRLLRSTTSSASTTTTRQKVGPSIERAASKRIACRRLVASCKLKVELLMVLLQQRAAPHMLDIMHANTAAYRLRVLHNDGRARTPAAEGDERRHAALGVDLSVIGGA